MNVIFATSQSSAIGILAHFVKISFTKETIVWNKKNTQLYQVQSRLLFWGFMKLTQVDEPFTIVAEMFIFF